jgi:uncharacterized protein with PIN domain
VHGLRRTRVDSLAMDLEEQTLERAGDRCEECGAKLTPREMEAVLESGGPVLCTIHADEIVPVGDDEAEFRVGD